MINIIKLNGKYYNLGEEVQIHVIGEEKKYDLESLIPLTRAVDLHNDPKYDALYSHQQTFQDTLIKNYGSKPEVIAKIESILPDIYKIKFLMMRLNPEEQQLNIKDRSIVHGDQPGNDDDEGADGVSYARNEEGYNWGTEQEMDSFEKYVDNIIDSLITAGVSESDAIRLIVLRLGLGKYGWQDSDGQFYRLGNYGLFVYSRVRGGKVRCFSFDDSNAGRYSDSSKAARTIVRS